MSARGRASLPQQMAGRASHPPMQMLKQNPRETPAKSGVNTDTCMCLLKCPCVLLVLLARMFPRTFAACLPSHPPRLHPPRCYPTLKLTVSS